MIEAKRGCVFAGTVNKETRLNDETGGRRFWPVKCGAIEIADLERDRDQLWAAARDCFRAGEEWWLDNRALTQSAADAVAERHEPDPWDDLITEWLKKPKERLSSAMRTRVPTSRSVDTGDMLLRIELQGQRKPERSVFSGPAGDSHGSSYQVDQPFGNRRATRRP